MNTIVLAVGLILLFPFYLSARPRTDIIELVNGNVINAEILSLSQAYLNVDTDSMGTLKIKWPDVVSITTAFGYVIEDSIGHRYYGTLNPGPDKTMVIATAFGTVSVPMYAVVNIYASYLTVWSRFTGSIDAGYSYTKSSTRSEFTLNGEIKYRSLRWEHEFKVESLLTNANGEKETERDTAALSAMRHLGNRWHAYSIAQYQHNLELGLTYRDSLVGGIARRFIQTNQNTLTVMFGAGYTREDYEGVEATNNAEAGIIAAYEFYKLYSPKIDLSIQFGVSPGLTNGGRVRTEFDTSAKIELIKDFFWSLGAYDSYDSKPPESRDVNQKHDYGVTTSFGYKFD
jgi:putative salt-induced outer membrane protein YdiY